MKTSHGLRIIALNTNMYYKDLLTKDLEDPADQFAWLDGQLSNAASNNEKVSRVFTISRCGSQHVVTDESSSLVLHSIYL